MPDAHHDRAPAAKTRRWPRRLRRLAFAAAGLAALGTGLYVTRAHTLHPLLTFCTPTVSRWLTPYEIQLEAIEGDWSGELALIGLNVRPRGPEPDPLRSLKAERATLRGDLLRAAMGNGVAAIRSVELVAPELAFQVLPSPGSEHPPAPWPELPAISVTRGTAHISGPGLDVEAADLEITGGGASPLQLSGSVTAPTWSARIRGSARLEGPRSVRFDVDVPAASLDGVEAEIRDLSGSWSAALTSIESGRVAVGGSEVTADGITIERRNGSLPLLGGDLRFNIPELGEARRALSALLGERDASPLKWSGSARGSAHLEPDPASMARGTMELTGENIVVQGVDFGSVEARAGADGTSLKIHALESNSARGAQMEGAGEFIFASRSFVGAHLTVRLDQPADLDEGLSLLQGVDLEMDLEGPLETLTGGVSITAESVALIDERPLRDVSIVGQLDAGVLDLRGARVETPFGELMASGEVVLPLGDRALDVTLSAFSIEGPSGELHLDGPARVDLNGDPSIEGVRLVGSAGSVQLDARGGSAPELALDASALRLGPFLPKQADQESAWRALLGPISGRARLSSTTATVDLRMPLPDAAEEARLVGSWDGQLVNVESVRLLLPGASLTATGTAALPASGLPFDPAGRIELNLDAKLGADALGWAPLTSFLSRETLDALGRSRGTAELEIDLDGSWASPRGTLKAVLGEWTLTSGGAVNSSPLPRPVHGSLDVAVGDRLEIIAGHLLLEDCIRLELAGQLERGLDLAALSADARLAWEDYRKAPLDVTATLDSEGLEELSTVLPDLRDVRGQVEGEVRLEGSIGAPRLTGDLVIAEGAARYGAAPPIEALDLALHLEENQIRVVRGSLELGASPVRFEGNVLLGQNDPRIDAWIEGEEVLLVRSEDARIRADLDLEVHGRPSALTVGGELIIKDGRVRSPIEFQSLLEGGGGPERVSRGIGLPAFGPENVRFDARIRTAKPIALQGRIARGGLRAELDLVGTAAAPQLTGSVFFDPLELAVPAGTISFPAGLVQLDPANPDIPRIDIVGNTRLAGYDVTVTVSGDYDQPDVELSSTPSLPADDLLLLVLSGQPPRSGGGLEAAGQSVALYVAKDLVRGWFASGSFDEEDRESFLDRLEVITGRDVSRAGVLTVEATYKLKEGLARERDALYVVLERDSFEDYGIGLRLVLRLR